MGTVYCGYRMISNLKSYLGHEYFKTDVTTSTLQGGLKSVYVVDGELTLLTSESAVKSKISEKYRRNQCASCTNSSCTNKMSFIYGWNESNKNKCSEYVGK